MGPIGWPMGFQRKSSLKLRLSEADGHKATRSRDDSELQNLVAFAKVHQLSERKNLSPSSTSLSHDLENTGLL